jgi:DNA replication protein DnaC
VNIEYHVEVEKSYYSVPYQLIDKEVVIRYSDKLVEIFYNNKRIALHSRLHQAGAYSTQEAHMAAAHRAYAHQTPSNLIGRAARFGEKTKALVIEILKRRPHPQMGIRSCSGILKAARHLEAEVMEAICEKMLELESYTLAHFKSILKHKTYLKAEPQTATTPESIHENIRGKLQGLKAALMEQIEGGGKYAAMSFEERLSLLIDREVTDRKNRSIQRMLGLSKLKDKQAHLSDLDYRAGRGIDKGLIKTLAKNDWIERKQNIIITGPTGTGKSFLASALANQAILSACSAYYSRISTLLANIALVRGDGSYLGWLKKLSRFRLLILDDLGLSTLSTTQTQELLEIIEDRSHTGSTIVTSQLPVKEWYAYFNVPTLADAIMDRLVNNSYRIELKGESMRTHPGRCHHGQVGQ